jgi:hypothetical protein
MEPILDFFLEGQQFAVYWLRPGDRQDPLRFFESLPSKTQASLAGTIRSYADEGKVSSTARGHKERWYHEALPPECPQVELFKFKDDPRIRFYAVAYPADGGNRLVLVLVFGFQDPKKGRERDRKTPTGVATRKAEQITLNFIASLRQK